MDTPLHLYITCGQLFQNGHLSILHVEWNYSINVVTEPTFPIFVQ